MKNTVSLLIVASSLSFGAGAHALTLEVQEFSSDGPIPFGYYDVTDGIETNEVLNVSAAPYVDYLIPVKNPPPGVQALKSGGQFVADSDIADFIGANSLTNPDLYQVVFKWEDGEPNVSGDNYFGVTWDGWSSSVVTALHTKINLASDEEVTVYHWFNDGWNYANGGHESLAGHVLTVTQYTGAGAEVATDSVTLPGGGAESIFGDHRQFYTAIIKATRMAPGDYLQIVNEAANIGYKGTVVAIGSALPDYGEFNQYPIVDGWADTGDFLGQVYVVNYPWVWVDDLSGFIYSVGPGGWYWTVR